MDKKPKCFGCRKAGDDDLYYWHNGALWHWNCVIYTQTFLLPPASALTEEAKKERFLKGILDNNVKLRTAIQIGDEKEIDRFIKNVLIPRGFTEEEAKLSIDKYR